MCPTCTQPATASFPGEGWECRNEACPEFGQPVRADEPPIAERAHPGRPVSIEDEPTAGR